jgi:hypothetical protein
MSNNNKNTTVLLADPNSTPVEDLQKTLGEIKTPTLVKSIMNLFGSESGENIERLAFEVDPSLNNEYAALYKQKVRLIPNSFLKKIAIQDDLVAAIVHARANQISSFGKPQPDRFSTGFKIELKSHVAERASKEQKEEIAKRIDRAVKLIETCGETKGWSDRERMTFSQFLHLQSRNALIFGHFDTEFVHVLDSATGEERFHSWRPIDAGTIYKAAPYSAAAESVRKQARLLLQQLKNKRLEPEKFEADEYAWVQVIEGRPVQAFTDTECVVHNVYPVTDVELQGYPLTPIDTAVASIVTHINIVKHNRLYFENGRAAKGMIVIRSDDVTEAVVSRIRQQFMASINTVNNSWRMPVFGVGRQDEINWTPIDSSSRDMEFQYLSDQNARVILSAFQMSPEELPGYAHLARGTNAQALAESNNEWKLEAARDVGIRPLLGHLQDFVNARIMPLVDPELAELAEFRLIGIDAETPEKENVRLQQDMPLHMTFDDVLQQVQKKTIGKQLGGNFFFNPQWQAVVDKYVPVGVVLEQFFGVEGAAKAPQFQYLRDPFWFQWQQIQMQQQMQQQQQQMQQQALQAQQQQQLPQQGQGEQKADKAPQSDDKGQSAGEAKQEPERAPERPQQPQERQGEIQSGIEQLEGLLSKSEHQLPNSKRKALAITRRTHKKVMDQFAHDRRQALKQIIDLAVNHGPTEE